MSLASVSCVFNTSVRVASQTLVCSFFCAVGQLFRETRVLTVVYGLSLVSTSVEHVLQNRGTVCLVFLFFLHLAVSLSLCAVCHPCTNRFV